MKNRLSKGFSIAMIVVLMLSVLSGCGNDGKQTVTILSANYEDQIAIQQEYLKEKFPDYNITITYMSSGKLAAKVQAEGEDCEADILLSLSSGYAQTLKNGGYLMSYDSNQSYRAEYADADNVVLPNGVWCGAILVNTTELEKLNLPEPTSYEDLLDPIYKGHIVMANPNSSSTGYFFLLGILNYYGEEKGWEYFDQLQENIKLFGESGSIPSSMVEMGEAAISLGMDYDGMRLENSGKPVKVIFAEEGAPYDYDTALLVNHGEEVNEVVLEVMAAITSPEGNAIFNNYNLNVLENGVDKEVYPDNFKLMDMTGIQDAELKTRLSEEWSRRYE